jgi:EAL domain-containing protein (putative c-di-GMP-specific phosphodiesterase class I)
LCDWGFWVAVDGVGFGRNGLESLIVLAPEIVVIDQRLSAHVALNAARARTLDRLIRVCRALKADVVAKGLQTPADVDVVLKMGATYSQSALEVTVAKA